MDMLFPGAIDYNKILNVKDKLLKGWQRRLSEKRTDIHVSDLILCRRKVAFERLNTEPPIVSEKKIKYFHGGIRKHQLLQELLGEDEFEIEKEIVWTSPKGIQIVGHADLIHKETGVIIELKTTESTRVLKEGPYEHHLSQLKAYLAITGSSYGKLLYMILGYPKAANYFPEYLVLWSYRAERAEILERLEKDAIELERGILERDPALVGHVATNSLSPVIRKGPEITVLRIAP
jgi:hypothetical protein